MLWGYEITDERGMVIGDEGDMAFRSKQKAFLDALAYATELVKDLDIEQSITIEVQPIDASGINSDWVE